MMSGLVCPHWDKNSLRQRYSCYFQISTVLFVYLWGRGSENRRFQNPGIAKIGFIPPPQFWHEFDQKKCTMWLATTTHIMNKWITRSRKFWNLPKKIKFPTISKTFRNRGTKTKSMWKCDKLRGLPLGKYVCIFKICNFPLHDKYAQNPNFSCSNAVRKIRAILSKYGSTSQSYPRRSAVRRKPIMLPLILRYYLYLCLCFLYFI